jgi:hypothetical protein
VSGDAELVVVKTLSTNDKDGGDGTAFINMNGGTVNVGENLELGDNGPGNLEVTDGLLVVGGTLELNKGDANLVGGEVRAGNLEIDTGVVMNIFEGGGLLILDGNKITQVVDLAHDGKIKAMPCDTSRIGCSGGLMVDFNVTNPGKTTLTASCAINICEPCANFPANGATEVQSGLDSGGVTLCWDEGDCLGMLGRNALYFSNDYNDVFDPPDYGIDPIYQRAGINCYNVGILELWETYYWRVDQLNQGGPTTRGPIWSFTTGCELIAGDVNMDCLVNFLDFAELASTFGEEEFWPE